MDQKPAINSELRGLIEKRMDHTIKAIEDTLQLILEKHEMRFEDMKDTIQGLEKSFTKLSQKWNLEILYALFLRNTIGFNELKKILAINSRTLSDKLKILKQYEYIKRVIMQGPPLRVTYSLTTRGRTTVLLALPLLYYSSG